MNTKEHAAIQRDPAQYTELRRFTPTGAPDGLSMILGIVGEGGEVQSIRADASSVSPECFRAWLKSHKYADEIEEATCESFDAFARWVPLELQKGRDEDKADEGEELTRAMIGGICSTRDMDLEGETIEQDGLDWSYFLENGWFNHEHQQGAGAVLGHPVSVKRVDDDRTRVEGVLYLHKKLGRDVYETSQAMEKAGGDRSLGFSVEGQVLQRDPRDQKRVLKARVLNVAITAMPINPHTNLELIARSIGADIGYQEPTIPDAGAALSSLIQQDLDARLSSATYAAPKTYTRAEVRDLLRERVPTTEDKKLDDLVDKIMHLAKSHAFGDL